MSPLWKEKDFKTVCLNQVVRQEDKEFVNALNQIRLGNVSSIDYFNTHCSIHELHEGIKLFGKKDKVEEMNNRALADIPENEKEYHAIIMGDSSVF